MSKQAWAVVTEHDKRSRKGARRVRMLHVRAHSMRKAIRKTKRKHWHVVSVMPATIIQGSRAAKEKAR